MERTATSRIGYRPFLVYIFVVADQAVFVFVEFFVFSRRVTIPAGCECSVLFVGNTTAKYLRYAAIVKQQPAARSARCPY